MADCIVNIDETLTPTAVCPSNDFYITLLLDDNLNGQYQRMLWSDFKNCTGGGVGPVDVDATIEFSVNADPNLVGTTFNPNTPELDTKIYVSTVDGSQWTWNGSAYIIYTPPFWSKAGNAGTTPGTHFIGTTDNKGLMFKTNNIQSGYINLIRSSTSFGYESLLNNANSYNTGFGYQALKLNSSGVSNSSLGYLALGNNTSGSNNTGVGHGALYSSATSSNNTAVGYGALLVSTGEQNTAVGSASLYSITSGVRNTALGFRALGLGTASNDNIAIGYQSLYSIGAGTYNISVGQNAMGSAVVSGNFNVGIGNNSLYSLTSGTSNIAIGAYSGYYNITGNDQVFINSLNRGSYANEQIQSPVYIQQHATVSSQNIWLNGEIYHPYLTNLATQDRLVGVLNSSGRLGNVTLGSGLSLAAGVLNTSGSVSTPISLLTAAGAINTIDNTDYAQTWNWTTKTSGNALALNVSGTAALSGQTVLSLSSSGANAGAAKVTYGLQVTNSKTGSFAVNYGGNFTVSGPYETYGLVLTSSGSSSAYGLNCFAQGAGANVAGRFSATGGSTNHAISVTNGSVEIGSSLSPYTGLLNMNGATSGTVTIKSQDVAGTWTMTLPTSAGSSGQTLITNGSGVTSWSSTPSVRISSLIDAGATNSIDNGNYTQTWNWSTLTSGALLINAASTAMTNSSYVFGVVTSGNNASSGMETRTVEFQNTHTGTSSTNVAAKFIASGGTENIAIDVSAGKVVIGGGTPDVSSIIDIKSTTLGLLLPRMTKVQRDAIGSPAAGLAVYQTDNTPGLRVYNGTNWMRYTETAD